MAKPPSSFSTITGSGSRSSRFADGCTMRALSFNRFAARTISTRSASRSPGPRSWRISRLAQKLGQQRQANNTSVQRDHYRRNGIHSPPPARQRNSAYLSMRRFLMVRKQVSEKYFETAVNMKCISKLHTIKYTLFLLKCSVPVLCKPAADSRWAALGRQRRSALGASPRHPEGPTLGAYQTFSS